MMSPNVDLGQVIIAGMLAVIGYFIKRELASIGSRLDKHDTLILKMFGDINRLLGRAGLRVREAQDEND